jgi:hypothetical protein
MAEPGEQALEQHRPHSGDGLQGQVGEFVGHASSISRQDAKVQR